MSGLLPRKGYDIKAFNFKIKKLCQEHDVEFVDHHDSFVMGSGEVPRSLFYGDKISIRPAGTATLVCNLESKCRILRKYDTNGNSSNKPGECPSNPLYVWLETPRICETELLRVENRYSALELLCEECDEIDRSNASHDSSIQASISYFDSDIACTDNYARLHSEQKGSTCS